MERMEREKMGEDSESAFFDDSRHTLLEAGQVKG